MYQGRQAAPAQAAGDRYGSRQPTVSAPPAAERRRRIGLAPAPESARTARAFTVARDRGRESALNANLVPFCDIAHLFGDLSHEDIQVKREGVPDKLARL